MPDLQRGLVFFRLVPAAGGVGVRELYHDYPFGLGLTFEQVDFAAPHDETAAKAGDARSSEWAIVVIGDGSVTWISAMM